MKLLFSIFSRQNIWRDAKEVAKEAEMEIVKAVSSVSRVSIQLRLGKPIPQFHRQLQEGSTKLPYLTGIEDE